MAMLYRRYFIDHYPGGSPAFRTLATAKRRAQVLADRTGRQIVISHYDKAGWQTDSTLVDPQRRLNPKGKRSRRRRKNPVRVAATVTGSGTGWIKAKAVRVVRGKGGATKVEVKR